MIEEIASTPVSYAYANKTETSCVSDSIRVNKTGSEKFTGFKPDGFKRLQIMVQIITNDPMAKG